VSSNKDLLSVTAFFSALLHAVIILGISFQLPDIAAIKNTDNTLDVVLVNRSNNETPLEAETVSTNNNLGGGNDDLEASSPIPYTPSNASPIESIKLTANQNETSSLAPKQVISAKSSAIKVEKRAPEETKLRAQDASKGPDIISTKAQRKLERERLIAKLNQRWDDYQKRPNKKYLSPTTKEHSAAKYLDDWRKRVEVVGNANYPVQAKAKSLSGTLILTVEINRNGTINSIIVNNPSPHKLLNDAAVRFVRDASPFSAFPDTFDTGIDILVITRAFHFLRNHKLSSTDASSAR
jgi:protein TonB